MFVRRFCCTAVKMLAAAVVVTALVGCSDDDDNGTGGGGGDPNVIGSDGNRFVGNWTYEEDIDNNNSLYFLTFKGNGDLCWGEYRRVDNFWVGGESCDGATWNADRQYINIVSYWGYERLEYNLSGNTLTFTEACYHYYEEGEEECSYDNFNVFKRGGSRPSGSIRSGDPVLNLTEWRMSSGWGYLEFWSMGENLEVSGVDYFEDYHDRNAWYTSGNTLYMLGLERVPNSCRMIYDRWYDDYYEGDCAYTLAETVEFTYTHSPRATLRLRNTSLGIDDTWEYYEYDDDYYYKRRDNNETDNRQSPFRRSQSRKALSNR